MYYNDETLVYLNGDWIKAKDATTSMYDQTLHYGNGVFEGIRSYKTESGVKIFKAKEHFERLLYSAEKMHIKVDMTVEEMEQISYQLLEKNNLEDAYIRPLISLGPNMTLSPTQQVHIFFCAWEWGKYLGDSLLDIKISSYQRPNPKSCHVEAKTVGHYINSILATTEAKAAGKDEALLLDANGYIAEGSGANFFMEKDGKLYTPNLGNILAGITRATVIDLAHKLEFPIETKNITEAELKTADSAFFTGTAAEVAGIKQVDDYVFPKEWKNSLGYELALAYQNLVRGKAYEKFELV